MEQSAVCSAQQWTSSNAVVDILPEESRYRRRVVAEVAAIRSCFDSIHCTDVQTGLSTNIST